jgi:Fic family protein
MNRGLTGAYSVRNVGGEEVRAFVPRALLPIPPLDVGAFREKLERALLALGRLDSVSSLLPDAQLFLYSYVRKEAVLSSQIEGTQSSLSDLLLFELEETPGVPMDDVLEVSSYVAALEHGLKRLRSGFPFSNRLIREIHEVLLSKGRGSGKMPGEFRTSQNWIGGSRPGNALYVPPPPERVEECMGELERFLNDEPTRTPPLEKAALAHVQFETIHPFLDGNGRVGRLLITLLLWKEGVLAEPLLYLSLYLKQNRSRYYELLQEVRMNGDWEAWLDFFADGVEKTSEGAVETARALAKLFEKDRGRIETVGRSAGSVLRVHHELQKRPLNTIGRLCAATRLTVPTVTKSIGKLETLGIVREVTTRKRGRVFSYVANLRLLTKGTEPERED